MVDDLDLEDRIDLLERKVDYLEHQTGISYDEYKFERKVSNTLGPWDVEVERVESTAGRNEAIINDFKLTDLRMIVDGVDNIEGADWYLLEDDGDIVVVISDGGSLGNRKI